MNWIKKNENMLHNEIQEKVYMEEINCFFIFVDSKKNIIKINKESADLEVNIKENHSTLPEKVLLTMIQNQKKNMHNISFLYKHAFSYLFDYNHDDVIFFIDNDKDFEPSMKEIPLMDNIRIPPSIYIFHDINCLYFFFEESCQNMKPILKIHDIKKIIPSKRVTIKLSNNTKSRTRKNNL
tara:strand:+ start:2775 stop:3317 length:543 start_codon:yes stop_codon:yes gene_type:complete